MSKKILLLVLVLSVTLLMGCGSSEEVKQIAKVEDEMLKETNVIAYEINDSYDKWESGQIDREQLSNELSKHYAQVKNIETRWDNKKESMTRQAIGSAAFWRINYMGNICYDLEQFIISGTQGYPSCVLNSNKTPIQDSELENSYKVNMVSSYNSNTEKAIRGIKEVNKFF